LNWVIRHINLAALGGAGEESVIDEVAPGNVFDCYFKAPYIYNALAEQYNYIKLKDNIILNFDYKTRLELDPKKLQEVEQEGAILCGWKDKNKPILVDKHNQFYYVDKGKHYIGGIDDVLQLDKESKPLDIAEMKIFSKYIPLGIILGFYLGFKGLLSLLKVEFRIVPVRQRAVLNDDEYVIWFADKKVVIKKSNRVADLILGGFAKYAKQTKVYPAAEFDNRDIYFNVLAAKGLTSIYVRELELLEFSFIDPISKEILEEMKEPTALVPLLLRATELLTTYDYPITQDRSVMRERGYERIASVIYKELMRSIRKQKNGTARSKINISPYTIWNEIMGDSSIKIVEDINPIQDLKQQEIFTYAGIGGRNKDTMTRPTRSFHPTDLGIVSESTVDNSNVGTIAYLSANPNYKNIRGMANMEKKELTPTNIVSTPALLSPGADHDVAKRIMFISTQHSHTIASPAYKQPYVRTGYEFVVPHRTTKMFSTSAKEDGKVVKLDSKGIVVEYKNGELEHVELGTLFGHAEGTVYPHELVSSLQVGAKVKKGDIIAYNSKFFEPDFIDPSKILLKINKTKTVAFAEIVETHEDSTAISQSLSDEFKTQVTKIKSIMVGFDQNVHEVAPVGTELTANDTLFVIEDEISANTGKFSEDSLEALKRLSKQTPKAKINGRIDKIEVYYCGDKEDMSATLKVLADQSDKELAKQRKALNLPVTTGQVDENYRAEGKNIRPDTAEVRFYITTEAGSGVGDKLVVGHQMKCTVSSVMPNKVYTEDGTEVDAFFSYRSLAARQVLSPIILGTTIKLLDHVGKLAVKLYKE
jgi:hypothetical protein